MQLQRKEAAALLKGFIEGSVKGWEVDDFISLRSSDPILEKARLELARIPILFPPEVSEHFTSEEGIRKILDISNFLLGAAAEQESNQR